MNRIRCQSWTLYLFSPVPRHRRDAGWRCTHRRMLLEVYLQTNCCLDSHLLGGSSTKAVTRPPSNASMPRAAAAPGVPTIKDDVDTLGR